MGKNWMTRVLATSLLCLLSFGNEAVAQNVTDPGTVTLMSTFESISVRAAYSGDANNNNSVTFEFRVVGGPSFKSAYTPFIDRSEILAVDEARGSIVGLTADSEYEVKVTWSDPDGIAGGQPPNETIRTIDPAPPTGGSTHSVANDAELAAALAAVVPGDTIELAAGTYTAPIGLTTNGTADAWITLQGLPGATIGGTTFADRYQLEVLADYWRVKDLNFAPTERSGININNGHHHVFIEDCVLEDVVRTATDADFIVETGINIGQTTNNVYVLRNQISTTNPEHAGRKTNIISGIFFKGINSHTIVVADNYIASKNGGYMRDGIGGEGNSATNGGMGENGDIARNVIEGQFTDDNLEVEGKNLNVRVWDNILLGEVFPITDARPAFGLSGTTVGPAYAFRNVISGNFPAGALKLGRGAGRLYFFHNTIDVSDNGLADSGGSPPSENHIYFNNIIQVGSLKNTLVRQGRSNQYNRNLHYNFGGGVLINDFDPGGDFNDLQSWQQATGQGLKSVFGDPEFANQDKDLLASSLAVDKGVLLPNFNDFDSAWSYSGNAPDMGAREFDAGFTTPQPPKNLRLMSSE